MTKLSQKKHNAGAKSAKQKPVPGTFETLASCSGATGIPLAVLKKAKRSGCPAFVFHRVELVPLLTWLFSENGETTVDWSAKFKEFQARREELKFEREKEELVPIADIREQDASACSKWNTERVRVEQEWPPRLAGKDIPECRTVLRELTSAIGGILETIRG
jgi:hypothetical protein